MVIKLNLNYAGLLPQNNYKAKARRLCELYAVKLRMTYPRAIELRYAFPGTDTIWPMLSLSIAEHAFMMAQLIVAVLLEFLDIFPNKNISPEKAESEALHHDDAEALTGDAATDVDGITRDMKDAAEAKSIDRQYSGLVCHSYMKARYETYEAKESYLSKLVKMLDALDLVLFAQYCYRNGVGGISRGANDEEYLLDAFGKKYPIDKRANKEVAPHLTDDDRPTVSIADIMYEHSLPRIEALGCPELTGLFKLICSEAFKFPFENYNLKNLPMDFAKLA